MLESKQKQEVINGLGKHKTDTGSSVVQVGLLTRRIQALTQHLKLHKKDNHSRRGLLQLVGQRRRLLNYMKNKDISSYQHIVKTLDLRK